MYGSGNNSFTLTKDRIEKANRAIEELSSELKKPNSIKFAIDKALNKELEEGGTLWFADDGGMYSLKKINGVIQKTYKK